MNPFQQSIFSMTADCLPCCAAPAECACALFIPITISGGSPVFGGEYPDYATALAVVDKSATSEWADCYAYFNDSGAGTITLLDSVVSSTYLVIGADVTGTGGITSLWACVTVSASTNLDFIYDGTISTSPSGYGFTVRMYDCATGTQSYSQSNGTRSGTASITGIAAGTYFVRMDYTATASAPLSATFTVLIMAVTGSMVPNPVIALWDDSGTTRQLEACPKLYLPILTESTGDWQSDCSNSQNLITNQVIDCLAFSEVSPFTSGSASGTAPFVVSITANQSAFIPWASFNGTAGDVWTFAFTRSSGPVFVYQALIYDYTGTLVETLSSGSSPLVSSALPYTGRYIVKMFMVGAGSSAITATVSVSSSGTLEVNPVQVLYDISLDCPARLNCGSACP